MPVQTRRSLCQKRKAVEDGAVRREHCTIDDQCAICHESLHSSQVYHLPCGHSFHAVCLSTWLWTKQNCPLCRQTDAQNDRDDVLSIISDVRNTQITTMINASIQAQKRNTNIRKTISRSKIAPQNSHIFKQVETYTKWKKELIEAQNNCKQIKQEYKQMQQMFLNLENDYKKKEENNRKRRQLIFFETTKPIREQIFYANKRISRATRNTKLSADRLSTIGDSI